MKPPSTAIRNLRRPTTPGTPPRTVPRRYIGAASAAGSPGCRCRRRCRCSGWPAPAHLGGAPWSTDRCRACQPRRPHPPRASPVRVNRLIRGGGDLLQQFTRCVQPAVPPMRFAASFRKPGLISSPASREKLSAAAGRIAVQMRDHWPPRRRRSSPCWSTVRVPSHMPSIDCPALM